LVIGQGGHTGVLGNCGIRAKVGGNILLVTN
jgi:hypothetical protein